MTQAHLEGFYYKPRVDKELLAGHSRGLVALSGCLKGEIAQAIGLTALLTLMIFVFYQDILRLNFLKNSLILKVHIP